MTYRQICSDIISATKSANLDDRLSYRFLKNEIQATLANFLKQDSELRKIFKINYLWIPIDCIEMEEANINDCITDIKVDSLLKTKIKVPKVFTTNYGSAIKVFNLFNNKEYKEIHPYNYKDIKNRPFQSKEFGYFWFDDRHIIIPDSTVENIRVYGLFKEDIDILRLNCNKEEADCLNPLDSNVPFPEYLIKIAKQEIVERLIKGTKQIIEDKTPNLSNK